MKRQAMVSLCLCAAACGASTQVVKTWRDPAYAGRQVKRVLVIGLTPKVENQQKFEYAVAERLQRIKIEPFTGYDVLPKGQMADRETVTRAVEKLAIDIAIVTKLVAVQSEAEYVPGTYSPQPGYYGMYPYYSAGYAVVYSPGYVKETQAVYLETNAYDAQAQKLVWSGLTRTFDYSSVDSISSSAAEKIVNALVDQGVL